MELETKYKPPFDLAEIAKRESFLVDLWKGQPSEKVAFQIVVEANRKLPYSLKQIEENPHLYLAIQQEQHKARLFYDDYSIPVIIPFPSVLVIATAFGCKINWEDDDTPPNTESVISTAKEVGKLKLPTLESGLVPVALSGVEYMANCVGDTCPIRIINHQGPFTNAVYLVGYEQLMMDLFDCPDSVHRLLEMITEFMIKFIKEQQKRAPRFVPAMIYPDWMPQDWGISIADDFLAVLSPQFYEEFSLKYNNILSEEFNGLHIHSCGDFQRNYKTLLKTKKLRGVNFEASDNNLEMLFELMPENVVLAPHAGIHAKEVFGGALNYVKKLLEYKRPTTRLHITIEGTLQDLSNADVISDGNELSEIVQILKNYNSRV